MFKPEYIQDNYNLFGWSGARELLYNQLRRMGKSPRMAMLMACNLMHATVK
jgi:hypothetical protein